MFPLTRVIRALINMMKNSLIIHWCPCLTENFRRNMMKNSLIIHWCPSFTEIFQKNMKTNSVIIHWYPSFTEKFWKTKWKIPYLFTDVLVLQKDSGKLQRGQVHRVHDVLHLHRVVGLHSHFLRGQPRLPGRPAAAELILYTLSTFETLSNKG